MIGVAADGLECYAPSDARDGPSPAPRESCEAIASPGGMIRLYQRLSGVTGADADAWARHGSIKTTPAVAAGLETRPMVLGELVEWGEMYGR